jgi:hypothetical protein
VRAAVAAIGVVLLVLVSGCGYVDDNGRAAAVVAQAYLDAVRARDAAGVCRVLAPEVQAALAAGKTCEGAVARQLRVRRPKLRVAGVREIPGPPGNPRFNITVPEGSGRQITVGRYGSIWRVVDGAGFIQ